jgi:hypothetical protein
MYFHTSQNQSFSNKHVLGMYFRLIFFPLMGTLFSNKDYLISYFWVLFKCSSTSHVFHGFLDIPCLFVCLSSFWQLEIKVP